MSLMTVFLAATTTLSLEALPAQQKVLVGEPVSVTLIWKAQEPAEVFLGDQDGSLAFLEVTVDDGSGPRRYREKNLLGRVERVEAPTRLEPGREKYDAVLLLFGRHGDDPGAPETFIFPRRGQYTVRIRYSDDQVGPVEANPVRFTVEEPSGADAEVFQSLGGQPLEIKYGGAKARPLLQSYPDSPYLRLARLDTFDERELRLLDRRDPRTDEPLWHLTQNDRDAFVRSELRAMADELLGLRDLGPFEETRLFRAADYARRGGDPVTAERVELEILERFPRSFAASRIRERTDKTPPSLSVTASPDSLWPPNHKLVVIGVAVQVSDDRDPHPSVKLVSITCDDACDPALDVVGATYGTDDRQFSLLAERQGTGKGRTYTITYSAEDASRNKTTATTKVTVPHDQGN